MLDDGRMALTLVHTPGGPGSPQRPLTADAIKVRHFMQWLSQYWLPVDYESTDPQCDARWWTSGNILDFFTNCKALPDQRQPAEVYSQKVHKSVLASSQL